jgi:solute carrier family 25 ornithine transporter 2/15
MIIATFQKAEDLSTLANASAGFFAAFFSSFTLCPTELIKCQLQAMREVQMQSITNGGHHQLVGITLNTNIFLILKHTTH